MTKPKPTYKYSVFGLVIDSEVIIPELESGEGAADVSIIFGQVAFNCYAGGHPHANYKMSKFEFVFLIEGVAKYCIMNGSSIIVEPDEHADLQAIRVYLMGTAMGVLLIQKGLTAIHGSAIEINGKSVIFTGDSGAGKTTLCTWFNKEGYKFLSDDVSAIKLTDSGIPMVQPAFSKQRVCQDTAEQLGYDVNLLTLACLQDEKKYNIDIRNNFLNQQRPLYCIIEIKEADADSVDMIEITGMEKIHCFMKNIYCALFYQDVGLSREYFHCCMRIIGQIAMFRLIRPKGKFTVDEQARYVISAASEG